MERESSSARQALKAQGFQLVPASNEVYTTYIWSLNKSLMLYISYLRIV